ncbi:MAG: toll/interleukin-1 receptor domain-containing protein, partial [Anaerolineae bacterium]|nr:toll/interleukin-1 receptor domain-containing protein [Anaerolineae bacterium]
MRGKHYFISYSTADGLDFAQKLHDSLESESIPAWLDKRDLRAGRDYDTQFDEAIRDCGALLFVLTPDSVADVDRL